MKDEINIGLVINDKVNREIYELKVKEDITAIELFNLYQLIVCYQQHIIMPHHDEIRYIHEKSIHSNDIHKSHSAVNDFCTHTVDNPSYISIFTAIN